MSESVVERRADGQARELLIAQRELQLAADESWALARERASDLRDKWGDLRERRLRQRENTTLRRENKCQASEATRALLESHILKLRQANEQLVITAVQAQTMADEIRRTKDAMGHMAQHDFLTDLPNRFLLTQRLDGAIALAQRSGKHFAVLFLDLDRFKVINDSLGHAIGDAVLQEVARRLLTVIRATDTASRQGGDEFVVILSEIADEHAVCEVAGKICEAIARPYELPDGTAHIGVTIGISMYPDDGGTPETLIRKADVAMYDAKHSGRDRYHFFRLDMNARAIERQKTESELHRALDRHEFVLHYQPKVNLATGAITGVEALLRWAHPERGLIAPSQFIPIAEECGLIVQIGRWAIGEACAQAKRWQDAGMHAGPVAVNISALEFRHADFIACVRRVLEATKLAPACLELEITEGILMSNASASAAILCGLKEMGVLLAVDDFGTGYSSLSYLHQFPVDVLKIDQSFIRDIGTPRDSAAIVGAVIAMGNSLGQRVVAEGVEHDTQLKFLTQHHCTEGQGYYFSKPLAAADFAALVRSAH